MGFTPRKINCKGLLGLGDRLFDHCADFGDRPDSESKFNPSPPEKAVIFKTAFPSSTP
ncbi:hypothetical protein [Picosynechococcus sp. NKBG15041c]|uniref:hypothetical protein n=1 Tax=Picosynechococcus sp. NKBG15041c TaxID=1407650 RepID=UPI00041886BC|nr:hypothetical protein [Picosynechococcus sp. NKBG15041c]